MNTILSVTLLLISGVSSRYLRCPKSNGKFPVENTDCKSYYECENGKVTKVMKCPEGQTFNPSLQWCDYEELYYCAEKEIEKYKRCKKASGKFPKENSLCRGYYECEKWKVTGEFTCPPGQNFNPEQQWCDWEELYPCLEDKPSERCPKPNGYFPKKGSQCKSYYQCINGKAYELQCPDDLIFDSVHSQCEWPELYSCDEMRESTTVETSSVVYTTTQPTSSTEGTSSTKIFTTASTERTKSTAKTRTTFTTDSVPTKMVSQSTKTESTAGTTSTTDGRSRSTETEVTDKYTLSSTEGSSGIRTTTTRETTEDHTTTPTEETSPYTQTERQTTPKNTLSTGGSSTGTETAQTQTKCIISSLSTAETRTMTDTFSTASIRTERPGDIVCPDASGLFPHPTDETKFLSCNGFIPTVMNCPENLIFDPSRQICTWRTRT